MSHRHHVPSLLQRGGNNGGGGGGRHGADGPVAFHFRPHPQGKLDLRALNRLDVARVAECVDIDALQRHLENVAFAALTEEDLAAHSDQAVVKGFRMAQLTIEYLLNVQDCLAHQLDRVAAQYLCSATEVKSLTRRLTAEEAVLQQHQQHPPQRATSPSRKHHHHHHHRHRRHHHHSSHRTPAAGPEPAAALPSSSLQPAVLRLYILLADGACVVATAAPTLQVHELKRQLLPDLPAPPRQPLRERDFCLVHRGLRLSDDKTLRDLGIPDAASLFCLMLGGGRGDAAAAKREEEEAAAREAARLQAEAAEAEERSRRLQREQEQAMAAIQTRLVEFEHHVLSFLEQQAQRQHGEQPRNPSPPPSPAAAKPPRKQACSGVGIDERVRVLLQQMERRIQHKTKRVSITSADMAQVRELQGLLSNELGRLDTPPIGSSSSEATTTQRSFEAHMAQLQARRFCLPSNVKTALNKIQSVAEESLTQAQAPPKLRVVPSTSPELSAPAPPAPAAAAEPPQAVASIPTPPLPPAATPAAAPLKPPKRRASTTAALAVVDEQEAEEEEEEEDAVSRQSLLSMVPEGMDDEEEEAASIASVQSASPSSSSSASSSTVSSILEEIEEEEEEEVVVSVVDGQGQRNEAGEDSEDEEEEILTIPEEEEEEVQGEE